MAIGNSELKTLELKIREQKYRIKAHGNADFLKDVLKVAQKSIAEVTPAATGQPIQNHALLALLRLAEEYVLARGKFEESRSDWENRLQGLIEELSDESGSSGAQEEASGGNPGLATELNLGRSAIEEQASAQKADRIGSSPSV